MKKMALVCLIWMLANACTKEYAVELPTSKKDLLTDKEWMVQKLEEKVGNGNWEDIFPQFLPCQKDNWFKFNKDFTVIYNEGALACPPNTPNQIIDTETWRLSNDETILYTGPYAYTILQLDQKTLVVYIKETIAGETYESKSTYIRK